MTHVVSNITLADLEKLKGYVEEKTKSPYEVKRVRNKDHLLILYTTGKLVVQGENSPYPYDIPKQKKSIASHEPIALEKSIGSDETLKGDTFGGLIVVGSFFAQDEVIVSDSKSYSEKAIRQLASELLDKYPKRFVIKELTPQEYNQVYAQLGSQTSILNMYHKEIGSALQEEFVATHVVDKYPGCNVGDIALTKAESHYTSVAAASIVARYKALQQFDELSKQAGFTLPKGSTHVKDALKELRERKLKVDEFCKIHFSTVKNF